MSINITKMIIKYTGEKLKKGGSNMEDILQIFNPEEV